MSKCFPHLDEELLLRVKGDAAAATATHESSSRSSSSREEVEDLSLYEVSSERATPPSQRQPHQPPAQQQLPTAEMEDSDNIISRRLWLYLLDRQKVGMGQLKWCQMSAQSIQGLAQELTKGVFRVNG